MTLALSLVGNLLLFGFLWFTMARAKFKIRAEKLATFAGFLAAATASIGRAEQDERLRSLAFGLSVMRGKLREDELISLLASASLIRLFRTSVAADVLGEHTRLLAYEVIGRTGSETEVVDYLVNAAVMGSACQEPREKFGDDGMANAQFHIESKILDLYKRTIGPEALKLFT